MTRLVLLPGLDGTGELFAPFIAELGALDATVVSYPPDLPMNYAEHEAHARAQLPANEDFVLLAESFSGPVGISIAAALPPGLKGLILCATFASNPVRGAGFLSRLVRYIPLPMLPTVLAQYWLFPGRGTPELLRAHEDAIRRVRAATISARISALLAVDRRRDLSGITVPMLYLRANQDRVIPRRAGLEILNLRPDIELIKFDAPHFLLQTEPAACAVAVLEFVKRCS